MAKGTKDWIKATDLKLQSIKNVSNLPRYGKATILEFSGNVIASTFDHLIDVDGNGLIYAAHLICTGVATQKNDIPSIIIDGNQLGEISFANLNTWNLTAPYSALPYLLKHDDVGFIYTASFHYGYSYDTDIAICYEETYGRTPYVYAKLYYAHYQ